LCGIAGILGRIDDGNREALRRMAAAMAHRGPDGEHFWVGKPDKDGFGCLLAHRRLSILDLSTAADQPMTDPVGGQTIIFNGEIYNFRQLRDALRDRGQSFQSTGDTAVMLRALALDGPDAVASFRGMFAFALWDEKTRGLTIARDPLGIKPLYICANADNSPGASWSLIFASEVRSILASGLLPKPRLNPAAVASFVWNGFVMGPGTIIAGVEQVRPAEVRTYDGRGNSQSTRFYWSLAEREEPQSMDDAAVREALDESVRLHLVSDVPLGVFLSSGVDSTAVANLAQKSCDIPINTFTLAFEDPQLNEGAHAARIAAAIGSRHREVLLTESDFVSSIEPALESLDQPTFDGINSYVMSKAVRAAGLKVALVGTGGDELFGGYRTFRDLPPLLSFIRRTPFLPDPLKAGAARLFATLLHRASGGAVGRVGPQTRWAKLSDMFLRGDDLIGLYQLSYALFLPDFQSALLEKSLAKRADFADCPAPSCPGSLVDGLPRSMYERLSQETQGHAVLSAISVLEQRCFLGERLLRDSDAASMAVSLEMRLPLVDQVLVEQVNRVGENRRYQPIGRKALLRKIGLRGLDPRLFQRPKSGFVLPFDRWIRQSLGRAMDQTMRDPALATAIGLNPRSVERLWDTFHSGSPGMYWSRVWAIYVLIRWCHRHGVLL